MEVGDDSDESQVQFSISMGTNLGGAFWYEICSSSGGGGEPTG